MKPAPLAVGPRIPVLLEILPLDRVVRAILAGEQARDNQVMEAHPLSHGGQLAYAERIRVLREELDASDDPKPVDIWKTYRNRGVEGIETIDGRMRVLIWSGDEGTGVPGTAIRVNSKGPMAASAFTANQLLLDTQALMFQEDEAEEASGVLTFVVVVHRKKDRKKDILRAEIALVTGMKRHAVQTQLICDERYPIPGLSSEETLEVPPEGPPFDFDVKRRG